MAKSQGLPQNHLIIPGFVLFVEPYSSNPFELCFVEVKRKDSHAKGNNVIDLIKLGKETQIDIYKLILQRVVNLETVGLFIKEGKIYL